MPFICSLTVLQIHGSTNVAKMYHVNTAIPGVVAERGFISFFLRGMKEGRKEGLDGLAPSGE